MADDQGQQGQVVTQTMGQQVAGGQPPTVPAGPAQPAQPVQPVGRPKEQVEAGPMGSGGGERAAEGGAEKGMEMVQEVPTAPEVEKKPELAGYVEKVGEEELEGPIIDDYTGQVLMAPAMQKAGTVTLPMTEEEVKEGLHHQIWESIRWLAEWCVRQIKVLHGRVRYKDRESK